MAHAAIEDQLGAIASAIAEIHAADAQELDELRTGLLGRKSGALTHVLRSLSELPVDDRRDVGQRANALKHEVEAALEARRAALAGTEGKDVVEDLTMPARRGWRGALHPVTHPYGE